MTKEEAKKQKNIEKMGKGLAIAGMICGIVSVVFFWSGYFSLILAIVALVFGIVSLVKKSEGKGMAIAGVATGGVGFIASILWILLVILAVGAVVNTVTESDSWKELENWSNNYTKCIENHGLKDKNYSDMTESEQDAYWECFSGETD